MYMYGMFFFIQKHFINKHYIHANLLVDLLLFNPMYSLKLFKHALVGFYISLSPLNPYITSLSK